MLPQRMIVGTMKYEDGQHIIECHKPDQTVEKVNLNEVLSGFVEKRVQFILREAPKPE